MPLTKTRRLRAGSCGLVLTFLAGCLLPVHPPFSRAPSPPPRIEAPAARASLVVDGGFEALQGGDPVGWRVEGKATPGAAVRVVRIPDAPEGERVAEIALAPGRPPSYDPTFIQDVPVEPWTTYDLSVWVRGIDLVSAVNPPLGYGQQCGLFFWLLGPDPASPIRLFPSGAYPRRDGTTPWELRKMRFTTPPREVFPAPPRGADGRFHLALQVLLFGTGTIQVDDVRLARSSAAPPPPRRSPGRLAVASRQGKPFFGLGLHYLPVGMTWRDAAAERIFNFSTGGGSYEEKLSLGLVSIAGGQTVDPACRGCGSRFAPLCLLCGSCPAGGAACDSYRPAYLLSPGSFGTWFDEQNFWPENNGELADLARTTRRIKKEAARLKPPGSGFYIFATDLPAGVYFNTYGWDDLAPYHASEAFDIVGTVRRGGNFPKEAVGGVMSEFRQTSINGIRYATRRIADDVTDGRGRQAKPVWMAVNGGSGKIVTDPKDPAYPTAPHTPAQLLSFRPDFAQLHYMLYAAVLNGATGLWFYQDDTDTLLTRDDLYWREVLVPAAAEMMILEEETGFLTEPEYNPVRYRLTGESGAVDSMLKRLGDAWMLVVANSSPASVDGAEFVLEEGMRIDGGVVEKLTYRHDDRPAKRRFEATPAAPGGGDRFPVDLPGYGVALYRFRISG
jgi:hypothetical protein